MPTARDISEVAAANARRANDEADRLEAEVKAAHARAEAATRNAREQQKHSDHEVREQEANASREIGALRDRLDRVLAAKVPATRPAPQIRGLARKFLHHGINETTEEYRDLEHLANGDPRFGELYGLNGTAARMMIRLFGIQDEALLAAVDALEVRSWAAVIERARVVAGEV